MDRCNICGLERDTVEEYVVKNMEGESFLDTEACKECRNVISKEVA